MRKWLCLLLMLLLPAYGLAEKPPIMVSIGLASDTVKADGRKVTAAGIGRRSPWGIHQSDVIYENLLYQNGQTRLLCLFQSSYPDAVGPVRSARLSHFYTREEWDAALVFCGDAGNLARESMRELALDSDLILNYHHSSLLREYASRQKGIKAPNNLSADLNGLSSALCQTTQMDKPLCFSPDAMKINGTIVAEITLNWGAAAWQTRLIYDPASNCYRMFKAKAPFFSYPSAQERDESSRIPVTFQSVIVQHVSYEWPASMVPIMTGVGSGRADFFISGQSITGSWKRESFDSPTQYLDTDGNIMNFPSGSIYIAQFPNDPSAAPGLYSYHP